MAKRLAVLVLLISALFWLPSPAGNALANTDVIPTLTDLPSQGSFIVLVGNFDLPADEDLLLFDVGQGQLYIWDLQPVERIETVLAHRPILLEDRIVGDDGRYVRLTPPVGTLLAISLASRQMAYKSQDGQAIWVANLDGSVPHLLVKTEWAGAVRWSADGRTLLFEDRFRIRRIRDDGSDLVTIVAFPGLWARIGDWSADGNRLTLATWDWLYHVDLADHSSTRLMAASPQDPFLSNTVQHWSPNSQTVALLAPNDPFQSRLLLWENRGATLRPIFAKGVLAAAWSPDGGQLAVWGAGDCQAEFDTVQGYLNQCSVDLYLIDADGRGLTRLTTLKIDDGHELETIHWFAP